ncbi:hypothetical protein ACOZB2_27865, partial [Pantoea endophytica]
LSSRRDTVMVLLHLFNRGASVTFSFSDLNHIIAYLFILSASLLALILLKVGISRFESFRNLKKLNADKYLIYKLHHKTKALNSSISIKQQSLLNLFFAVAYLLGSALVIFFSCWLLTSV